MKIMILTRSMNSKLYDLSMATVQLDYRKKKCRFTSADSYLYDRVVNSRADIVINIDEDAFVIDNNRLKNLLTYVLDNDYVNCGVSDGGVIPIRKHNPLVTNPFFNIINVAKVREKFDLKNIKENYSEHRKEFEKFTPFDLMRGEYAYDYYEPYVAFFVWMATNFKTLYLDADTHKDGISTILKDHDNQPFMLHSWYSRFYGVDEHHTQRINNLYLEATGKKEITTKSSALDLMIDKYGNKYFYPLKYRWERKVLGY